MKFVEDCRFLKLEIAKTKKDNKEYGLLSVLDSDNNSHKFYIFDDLKNRFLQAGLKQFESFKIVFETYESDKAWAVRILDFGRNNK